MGRNIHWSSSCQDPVKGSPGPRAVRRAPTTVHRMRQLVTTLERARLRLGLSLRSLFVAAGGLIVLAGSLSVFGGATEDVTRHNGLSTHDATRLRFFTLHRPD